jgi:hypothetical protein
MADYETPDEGDLDVKLEDEDKEPDEKVPAYDDDSLNLVFDFAKSKQGKEYLKKISMKVDSDYQSDWDASDEYRSNRKADWKLFSGDLPKKKGPIKDASNPHIPIMLENLSRLCYRATGELFSNWQTVLSAVPVGADDADVASFVTRHMNWQFNEQIPDFKRQIGHRGVLTFFAMGDVVVHSYYDQETRLNRHEVLTCDNFVTPYMHVTTMPDFSDCPHYTKILRFYRHQIEARDGEWYDVDKVLSKNHPSWDDEPDSPLAEAVAETQGISPETSEQSKDLGGESAPFTLLWYEGWLRLPNQEKDRWCQVIQDKHTRCILSLIIHERLNWQDKERHDGQVREKNAFGQMMDMYQQQVMQHQELEMQAQQGVTEVSDALRANVADGAMLVDQATQIQAAVPPPPQPPPPPNWMIDKLQDVDPETGMPPDPMTLEPEPPRREPVHLFTHGVCIEPLHGNLGLSYGLIQADLNRAANVALAQFTDQATLGNSKGYITSGLEFEDEFIVGPGVVNKAMGAIGGALKDHIIPMEPGPANPQLKEIVELMVQTGQNSIQSPNVLSGEAGKSGETAKGLMGRIEQATKQLSVVTGKYADVVVQVGKNNAYLNSVFLPEDELVRLLNTESQQYEEIKIGRAMYERGYRFQMRADLRFATQIQKIEEADTIVQMCLNIPPLAMNAAMLYTALKESFIARGRYDLVQLMGKPPPPMIAFPVPGPPMPPPGAPGQPQPGGPPSGPPQPAQNAPPPNGPPS